METQARPCHQTMKRQTDEQVELYAERDAYGAGAEFPVNRTPFTVADDPPSEGELRTAVSQLSHGRCGGASGRGSTLQVPASFFGIKKNKGLKFHVTRCFDSRESKSLFTSPPSQWCSTLPPPLARFIPPLRGGINRSLNVRACRLPRGVL